MAELKFLSLGWGVQSFTIAAMTALEELAPVDLAIHADTTHEAEGTYRHAEKYTPWLESRGLKVVTVTAKRAELVREDWGTGSVMVPAFSLAPDGSHGQIRRQCTHDWKLSPIRQYIRGLMPPGRPQPGYVECQQGISMDEWTRMRTSDVQYIVNQYPLVERRMARADCVLWLEARGLDVPPKSACVFCPYHSLGSWKRLKRAGGQDWAKAVEVDSAIRNRRDPHSIYIHPARLPLEEAVRIPEDVGAAQLEMEMPCDGGVCFV